MPPKPKDYFLSDADNAAIFEQQIRPAEFGSEDNHTAPVTTSRPVCIILAGQTGAGKSHAAPALVAALQTFVGPSSLCHLVADTHKPYHPAYAGLVTAAAAGRVPPGLASAATGHDARRWLARACRVAAMQRRTTLVESASRYPADVVGMAGTFRAAGYRVSLVLLGVHAVQSRLGLLARYLEAAQTEEEDGGRKTMPVRLTPRAIHDESYAGLATLAGLLDAQGGDDNGTDIVADAVLILRRGNWVAYANDWQPTTRSWQTLPAGVGAALASERARRGQLARKENESPLDAEAALFASDVARLRTAHPERAAELDAFAAEFDATADEATEEPRDTESAYYPLDPEALVAHLQSSEW